MATGLATRCSACGTVFRVVPDQLRVSEGWVRCGRCAQVFNALEGLVDLETGLPRMGGTGAGLAPPVPAGAEDDYEFAQPAARPGGPPLPGSTGLTVPAAAPDPTRANKRAGKIKGHGGGPLLARPSREDAPAAALASGDMPTPAPANLAAVVAEASDSELEPRRPLTPAPSFVRSAERAARWQQPRVRLLLAGVALTAALSLALQLGIHYRDLLAARWPELRPLVVQACRAFDCKVEAARSIDGLAVDSSGLLRVDKSDLYRLQVSLRNRAAIELAVPALDLTVSDAQGRLIARKVLRLAELGAPQATIAPGRELALQATLQTLTGNDATQPPGAIAGYTVELFYP